MNRFILTTLFALSGFLSTKAMEEIPMHIISSIEDINPQSVKFDLDCKVQFNNGEYTVVKNKHKVRESVEEWNPFSTTHHTVILTRPLFSLGGYPMLEDTIVVEQWACGMHKKEKLFKDTPEPKGFYRNQSTQLTRDAIGIGSVIGTWLGSIMLYKATHS